MAEPTRCHPPGPIRIDVKRKTTRRATRAAAKPHTARRCPGPQGSRCRREGMNGGQDNLMPAKQGEPSTALKKKQPLPLCRVPVPV